MSKKTPSNLIAQNKKARHYFELLEFVEAGIVLTGSEMKSIRLGAVNFRDSYVSFREGEAFLIGLHIAPYANAGYSQHDPDRDRKLLLHAKEIGRLALQIEQKGLSLVPVNMHFTRGKVKVELAVGRGKKMHDHRETLKQAAALRDAQREMSSF
ncbi:SsrA-binding protein SmpB [Desulfovibrio cuneatus]|uniref:SsrA-binding protein SmpB n=1 Tax=Desulfovibrio cuneatus TaxID=159728 RepID=UPI00040237EE|nr:SsrA-binding protein SmpB [Desulfovibrio cuneatus]